MPARRRASHADRIRARKWRAHHSVWARVESWAGHLRGRVGGGGGVHAAVGHCAPTHRALEHRPVPSRAPGASDADRAVSLGERHHTRVVPIPAMGAADGALAPGRCARAVACLPHQPGLPALPAAVHDMGHARNALAQHGAQRRAARLQAVLGGAPARDRAAHRDQAAAARHDQREGVLHLPLGDRARATRHEAAGRLDHRVHLHAPPARQGERRRQREGGGALGEARAGHR
mmetsp:Transcript_17488/g.43618  ORF Transcript_17488/g.43618 Transcript_17488/m.43618 type:complete len:233 (-) Transcript_17488:876-1574(-)